MPSILVVEDSPECQLMIRHSLSESYAVKFASNASEAASALEREEFDCVVLDANLPDQSGFNLCTQWRSREAMKDVPIIFVSGRGDVHDKVAAFTAGAEDYVVKPFDSLELRARIEARVLRRMINRARGIEVRRGGLKLEVDVQRAVILEGEKEKELNLTPHEFKILHCLIMNEDRVLSREQIMRKVWGAQVYLFDRVVDKHISTLRSKIKPKGNLIQTVSGVGYRFSAK